MASFQQGFIPLTTSTSEYVVTFPVPFSTAPSMVLTQVINTEGGDTTHMWIEGVVHSRSSASFSVVLNALPDTNYYILVWMAAESTTEIVQATSGMSLAQLPYYADEVPDMAKIPVLIPGAVPTTKLVTFQNIKNTTNRATLIKVSQITNLASNRSIILTGTKVQARTELDVYSKAEMLPAKTLEESFGAYGRTFVTLGSASAARTSLDVPSNDDVEDAITKTAGITNYITSFLASTNSAQALSAINAAASDHTHTPAELGAAAEVHAHDVAAITTGPVFVLGLLHASTIAEAREAIEVLPDSGWKEGYTSIGVTTAISPAYFGKKLLLTASVDLELASLSVEKVGRIDIIVNSGVSPTIKATSGQTLYSETYGSLATGGTSYILHSGFHVLERTGDAKWVLHSAMSKAIKDILFGSATVGDFKTNIAMAPEDLDVSEDVKTFLESANIGEMRSQISGAQTVYEVDITGSSYTIGDVIGWVIPSVPGAVFSFTGEGSINLDLANLSVLTVGQGFKLVSDSPAVVYNPETDLVVNGEAGLVSPSPIKLSPNEICEFLLVDITGDVYTFVASIQGWSQYYDTVWVDAAMGSDITGKVGNAAYPYKTLEAAATAIADVATIDKTGSVVVMSGKYEVTNGTNLYELSAKAVWHFMPGAYIKNVNTSTSSTALFQTYGASTAQIILVTGYGVFDIYQPLVSIAHADSTANVEASKILVRNETAGEAVAHIVSSGAGASSNRMNIYVRNEIYSGADILNIGAHSSSYSYATITTPLECVIYANGNVVNADSGNLDVKFIGGNISFIANLVNTAGGVGVVKFVRQSLVAHAMAPTPLLSALTGIDIGIYSCLLVNYPNIPLGATGKLLIDASTIYGQVNVETSNALLLRNCVINSESFSSIETAATPPINVVTIGTNTADVDKDADITILGPAVTVVDPGVTLANFAAVL